jgi:site-specific DNA-cytosine methylase
MKLLELFSGTHSIGKVAHDEFGYDVVSVDMVEGDSSPFNNYKSPCHIQEDIMTWDYKIYPPHTFDVITASPVCLWWSHLRVSWVGRKSPKINPDGSVVTHADLQRDIDNFGKPMVDKVIEILEYFQPKYWWIENPASSRMKDYISEAHTLYDKPHVLDYCAYGLELKKTTRIWTNIPFSPKRCIGEGCKHMQMQDLNASSSNNKKGTIKQLRYRVPYKLVRELLTNVGK